MSYTPPKYPGEIPTTDDLPDKTAYKDLVKSDYHNAIKKELRAALIEFGVNPSGAYDTVALRLAAAIIISNPVAGDIIYHDGNNWVRLAKGDDGEFLSLAAGIPSWIAGPGIPSGLIAMWHGLIANIPAGWVICDGNNSTPNLLDKFVKSVPNIGTNPGGTGGAASVTLTETQIPSHLHSIETQTNHQHTISQQAAHAHSVDTAWIAEEGNMLFGADKKGTANTGSAGAHNHGGNVGAGGSHNHGGNTGSKGGSTSHENRPPYYQIAFIMKS